MIQKNFFLNLFQKKRKNYITFFFRIKNTTNIWTIFAIRICITFWTTIDGSTIYSEKKEKFDFEFWISLFWKKKKKNQTWAW